MADAPPPAAASAVGRVLGRVVLGLWRIAAYGLLTVFVLACLAVYGCPRTRTRDVIPSPDRNASLLIDRTDTGSSSPDEALFLVGRSFDEGIALGSVSPELGGIGWIDDTTLNVCPLRGDSRLPRDLRLMGADGTPRTYRIVAQCTPKMVGETELVPQVAGFDFDGEPVREAR